MATFVLVHGAWSGSFVFQAVRRSLQAQGHEVFTPSLTGIGERVHLASPQVGLSTHIQDVVNQVLYEDLNDIVLLGYAYGGVVVTGCVDHIAARISHLVYLDAFLPDSGQSMLDLVGLPRPPLQLGGAHYLPPPDRDFDDPDEALFQNARRVPQPVASLVEAVQLSAPLESYAFSRSYIRATERSPTEIGISHFAAAAARARALGEWQYKEIESNHRLLIDKPQDVADILLALEA